VARGKDMYGIGIAEIIVVLFLVLLVFGTRKLPEVGRGLGKVIRELKAVSQALTGAGSSVDTRQSATTPDEVGKRS
jgi:sec-independent protein translocase protein TatA